MALSRPREELYFATDRLRALGIILVILFHINFGLVKILPQEALTSFILKMPEIFNIFWHSLGSEIIFFSSSLILSTLLFRELDLSGEVNFRNYYIRRTARILPLYYLALLLYSFANDFSIKEYALNILLISKLFGESTIVPVGWSLELQAQFYIILPLFIIAIMKFKHPVIALLVLLAITLAARGIYIFSDETGTLIKVYDLFYGNKPSLVQKNQYYLLPFRAPVLVLGMLAAYLHHQHYLRIEMFFSTRFIRRSVILVSLLLIALGGLTPIQDESSLFNQWINGSMYLWYFTLNRFIFISGVFLLYLAAMVNHSEFAFMPGRITRMISRCIYPIYLFHFPMIILAAVVVFQTTDKREITGLSIFEYFSLFILTTLFSTIFGFLVCRFFEIPLNHKIRKLFIAANAAAR